MCPTLVIVSLSSSPGNPAGKITIQAEEVQDSKFVVDFELSATKLEKKDLFGKVDIEADLHVLDQSIFIFHSLVHKHTHTHTHTHTHNTQPLQNAV